MSWGENSAGGSDTGPLQNEEVCLNSPTPTAVLLPAVPLGVDEQNVASVVDGRVRLCAFFVIKHTVSKKNKTLALTVWMFRFCRAGGIVLPVLVTARVTCDHGRDQAQLCETVPTASLQTPDLAEALSNEQRHAPHLTSIQVSKYVF